MRALVAVAQTMAESRARRRLDRDQLAWIVVGVVVVACFALRKELGLGSRSIPWIGRCRWAPGSRPS